jgi:hypothetical protein
VARPEEESPEPKPDADKCPACGGWIGETGPESGICLSCRKTFGEQPPEEPEAAPSPVCPKCGANEDADAAFCDQCGSSMSASPSPSAGTCPACGGPVVEISPDRGICRKCGEKLMTPEAQALNRVGLVLALVSAAAYIAWLLACGRPTRGY